MKVAIDTKFKIGDRVYHYIYGWGNITNLGNNVVFDKQPNLFMNVNFEKKLLSFTEYTIEGFSQERPKELPKKGDIVWGRNEFPSEWHIGHFYDKLGDNYLISSHPQPTGWNNIVKEITNKNPYADENAPI
jgi:hypothetical protein